MANKELILLIGGPGTGKSTLINALTKKGYCCYPEISREVTLKAQQEGIDQLFLEDPILFSRLLLEGRIKQFEEAQTESHEKIFIDRGIPDVLAYMHFIGDNYPEEFDIACKNHRYDKIFMLPPWEEIYVSDGERYENYQQAKEIYLHLKKTYEGYGYQLIEVPKDTIENRLNFIFKHL